MVNNYLFVFIYVLAFLLILLGTTNVFAQEKKISYLQAGETATFQGVLLSPEAFSELKVKSEFSEQEIQLRVDFAVEKALLGKQLEIDNLNTKLEWQEIMWKDRLRLKNNQIDDLYIQLEKEMKTSIWERLEKPFYFTAGVGLSVGMFLLHKQVSKID